MNYINISETNKMNLSELSLHQKLILTLLNILSNKFDITVIV